MRDITATSEKTKLFMPICVNSIHKRSGREHSLNLLTGQGNVSCGKFFAEYLHGLEQAGELFALRQTVWHMDVEAVAGSGFV